ncbi:MAG TPA: hypothetical protein PKA63_01850 [Oligoflexia bacterium]|nr:hypothetical protein [Oligoflexia bacterium]HMP47394.1 hypothetical protein [Oligoflexia bacterium]
MNKYLLLNQFDRKLFRAKDIGAIWGVTDTNTLHTTLKRYAAGKKIFRLQKGLYSIVPPETLDPLLIARSLIPAYCYLSLDTVLFQEGFRSAVPHSYTFVSEKRLDLSCCEINVTTRKLKLDYLYNPIQTEIINNIRVASALRAICDTLYYNPKASFDRKIDWRAVIKLQKEIGYKVTDRS